MGEDTGEDTTTHPTVTHAEKLAKALAKFGQTPATYIVPSIFIRSKQDGAPGENTYEKLEYGPTQTVKDFRDRRRGSGLCDGPSSGRRCLHTTCRCAFSGKKFESMNKTPSLGYGVARVLRKRRSLTKGGVNIRSAPPVHLLAVSTLGTRHPSGHERR